MAATYSSTYASNFVKPSHCDSTIPSDPIYKGKGICPHCGERINTDCSSVTFTQSKEEPKKHDKYKSSKEYLLQKVFEIICRQPFPSFSPEKNKVNQKGSQVLCSSLRLTKPRPRRNNSGTRNYKKRTKT